MGLIESLNDDLKSAMKAGETLRRDVLRMVLAGMKNRRIELGDELDEAQALAVLRKAVKTRQDSATQYEQAGRQDLADQEAAEILVIEGYLPKQLSPARTEEVLGELVQELGLSGKADMGRLMKEAKSRFGDELDGKTASGIAARLLS